ncbi:MAG: hypothetical protein MR266_02785 [Erysipelotrichaceae bacterium]|nr:hypothetical protein [Erysipelotrichaceae bacterium]
MTVNSYDRNILKKGILYVFLIIITILIIVLELIKFECKNTYTYKFKKYKDNILIEVKLSDLIKIESSNYLVIDKKKYDFIIVNNYLNNKTCLLEIKIKGSIKEFNSYEVSFIRVIEIRKFIVNSMKGDKK